MDRGTDSFNGDIEKIHGSQGILYFFRIGRNLPGYEKPSIRGKAGQSGNSKTNRI
jgi:hypothetical protein